MTVSVVVAAAVVAAGTTFAQAPPAGRGGGRPAAPSAQAAAGAATDPKKVIEAMQDNLGMLRGMNRMDALNRVELWGTQGSKMIGGRQVPLSAWKISLNFTMSGMRFDYTHDGQRTIEVVSDKWAWNEDAPGGKATPMPGALAERQLLYAMTPVGFAKAAKANEATAKVAVAGGVTTLTINAVGAVLTATLNKYMMPEKIEARQGTNVTTVAYSEYGEWNDDAKADVYLPKRMVVTQNGQTSLDLTLVHTNTYNPYVIMPVPENVRGARTN
jgi:hypothetical protein